MTEFLDDCQSGVVLFYNLGLVHSEVVVDAVRYSPDALHLRIV